MIKHIAYHARFRFYSINKPKTEKNNFCAFSLIQKIKTGWLGILFEIMNKKIK
jgi:hypothetical protein